MNTRWSSRSKHTRRATSTAAVLATLVVAAGCGNVDVSKDSDSDAKAQSTPSASPTPSANTSAGEGNWLLGMVSAGGADAEASTTVYVTFNPSTGVATARKIPAVETSSTTPQQAALLVSADRRWAIPDTGIADPEVKSGQLKVYSLQDGATKVIDIRKRAGDDSVKPIGWAFDPAKADTLRVVDTKNRVWTVDVAGGKAVKSGTIPHGAWVFTNGFNPNSGEPYVESIDSDKTLPAGNGPDAAIAVSRSGGTVLPSGSADLTKLPASPCRLAGGFTDANGVTWAFCADDPSVKTYYLPQGATEWTAYGKPSTAVAPEAASFPLVLPPAS